MADTLQQKPIDTATTIDPNIPARRTYPTDATTLNPEPATYVNARREASAIHCTISLHAPDTITVKGYEHLQS